MLLNKNRERLTRWWINGWTTKASGWRRWMVLHNEGTAFVGHVMTHDSGDGEISFWPRMLADERWRLPLLLPIHGRATHIFTSTDGQHDGWLTSIHLEIIWITANPKETGRKNWQTQCAGTVSVKRERDWTKWRTSTATEAAETVVRGISRASSFGTG